MKISTLYEFLDSGFLGFLVLFILFKRIHRSKTALGQGLKAKPQKYLLKVWEIKELFPTSPNIPKTNKILIRLWKKKEILEKWGRNK